MHFSFLFSCTNGQKVTDTIRELKCNGGKSRNTRRPNGQGPRGPKVKSCSLRKKEDKNERNKRKIPTTKVKGSNNQPGKSQW